MFTADQARERYKTYGVIFRRVEDTIKSAALYSRQAKVYIEPSALNYIVAMLVEAGYEVSYCQHTEWRGSYNDPTHEVEISW